MTLIATGLIPAIATSQQPVVESDRNLPQKSITKYVMTTVTVTDKHGRYVTGLKRDSFVVLDEKTPQEIVFFSDRDVPISVGILVDTWLSIRSDPGGAKITSGVGEALSRLVRSGNINNEYFLMTFGATPQLSLDTTTDKAAVLAALENLRKMTRPSTALYDACYLGIKKILNGAHRKRAILLVTDAVDSSSKYSFRELRQLQQQSDVLIYVIYLSTEQAVKTSIGLEMLDQIDSLALGSGATRFAPRNQEELNAVLDRIGLELRQQYTIGFKPSVTATSNRHRIKVKVSLNSGAPDVSKDLVVRNRESY